MRSQIQASQFIPKKQFSGNTNLCELFRDSYFQGKDDNIPQRVLFGWNWIFTENQEKFNNSLSKKFRQVSTSDGPI
jgi:hypothetical protein